MRVALLLLLTALTAMAAGSDDRPDAPKDADWSLPPLAQPADPARGLEPYVVPVPAWMTEMPVPADNPLTHAGVDLGRRLFYDPLLSGNNTQSCSSCHLQSLAFTDGRPHSIGSEGKTVPRNAMSLVNLAWSPPYFWDGRAPTLEALATMPIEESLEMNQPVPELLAELAAHPDYPARFEAAFPGQGISKDTLSKAIAQFLRTLVSFRSRADDLKAAIGSATDAEKQGMQLMSSPLPKDSPHAVVDICNACHDHAAGGRYRNRGMGTFTTGKLKTNGLPATIDLGLGSLTGKAEDAMRFKVPTIRNLTVTAPYMHDGRFATLVDVVRHYNEQIEQLEGLEHPLLLGGEAARLKLDESEVEAIAATMALFTDESFLTNPAYSNPFVD
jgi:cytochrome c peroxidase